MIDKIKQLLSLPQLIYNKLCAIERKMDDESKSSMLKQQVAILETSLDNHCSKELCREILKVKDFSNVKREMTIEERKAYVADASVVYNSQAFKDIITEIQFDQLVWMGLQADNDRQLMIGRGTINGADLIEQRMAELHAEYLQNLEESKPIEDFNKFNPINN